MQVVLGKGEQLPFADATFDALTFTYLLRYVEDPQATLRELARVVRPGGTVGEPRVPRPLESLLAVLVVGLHPARSCRVGGAITGGREWFRVGRFLGPNISAHYRRYPLSWTVEAWREAGIDDVGVRTMSLGGGLVMWGSRAGG